MKKRILSIMLVVCMVFMLVPTTVFAGGAGGSYSLVKGTDGAGDNEGPGSLIDGTADTKWCVTNFESANIIFKTSSAVNISGYSITTGNDNVENKGRNPKNWTLYGCNNYTGNSTDNWAAIHRVSNDTVLQDKNKTTYHFVFDKTETAYQYYKLEITAIQAGDTMQMSEFALTDCAHNWDTASVEKKDPTSCTDQGYIKTTCKKCQRVKIDVIAPLAHDFSAGDGKCKYCSKTKEELLTVSVSAYATKAQLMDNTFAPDSNGNATNIGKLVFGKNSSGKAQEWYILGKDQWMYTDNTIIFAASSMTNSQFNPSQDDITIANISEDDTRASLIGTYRYSKNFVPTTVYANYYGISSLRATLNTIAMDKNYFTAAEQDLMNSTSVGTNDINNSDTYFVTDKLYALEGTIHNDNLLWAGTGDVKVLAKSNYWGNKNDDDFWLRSPMTNVLVKGQVHLAYPGDEVSSYVVDSTQGVRPASNLNVSSVLFASSATATSSSTATSRTIASEKAMTLRLNGSNKNIGTVTYNPTTGDIKATANKSNVSLVVQGKDGTTNWCYSKLISGTEFVSASDIAKESSTPASVDLSTCKIWLEIKDTDGMIYAVNATQTSVSTIYSVEITGVDTPTTGEKLDTVASCTTTGASSQSPAVTWSPANITAQGRTVYTVSITLTADNNYEFSNNASATVNGNQAASITKNADGTLTVTYQFPITGKAKVVRVAPVDPITVPNGTAYKDMGLPRTTSVYTNANSTMKSPVTWDTENPAEGSYNPNLLEEQTVTLNGTVTIPSYFDTTDVDTNVTIKITISKADNAKAPTASPASGTYTSDQSVELQSATDGAEIYYTTDGSTPNRTRTKYTGPIHITGTESKSTRTTVKAIAVKQGMYDSSVATYTYTISIPDSTAPNGEIKINENRWQSFSNDISFNLFFKNTQTVTITATDNSEQKVSIGYLLSDKKLEESELAAKTFVSYNEAFSVSPNNKYIIYAKLTDNSNNVKYINSNGIVLDNTPPVISGVENGKTYCSAQTVTITEEYLKNVTLDGEPVTLNENHQFTLSPLTATQEIVVTDKAGNQTNISVKINNGHTPEAEDNDCTTAMKCSVCNTTIKAAETTHKWGDWVKDENADTHTHRCKNEDCKASETESCKGGTATCQAKAKCTTCKDFYGEKDPENHIQSLSAEWQKNENGHWKIYPCCPDTKVGEESHTGSDDGDCTTAVQCKCGAVIKQAETTHNWSSWKQDDEQDTHTRICQNADCNKKETEPCTGGTATCKEKAICSYCDKEYGELDLSNHDLEIIPEREATVTDTGNTEYWHCKDCENNFSDPDGENGIELKDTVIPKLPPEIIKGMGQSVTTGEKKTLSFTSNAAYRDFIRVEIDGKTLDAKNYTVKEGGTVVTLKSDYVATLPSGRHTIGIVSESGTATTAFTVNIKVNAWEKTILRLQAAASQTSIKMKWNAVPEADGYVIYWNKCGAKHAFKPIKVIKSGRTLTWTHSKRKKNSWNRYYVKAYKVINGKKYFIKSSNRIHLVTKGGKYTNVKKLKSSASSVILKKGKTKVLRITQTYAERNKKPVKHMRPLIYTTSNKKVATVTSKGVIKANGKGSCYIYITAYSGVYTRVKVTVK